MVWAGATKYFAYNENLVKVTQDGFDADAEVGDIIDFLARSSLLYIPSSVAIQLERTAGSTGTVSVIFAGSIDQVTWTTIKTLTAHNELFVWTTDFTSAAGVPKPMFSAYRITVTTVGTGNTLKAHMLFRR